MKLYDDTMDARLYTDYMARDMKPCALRLWPNEQWFFLQDNASYHSAGVSRAWFHNNGGSLIPLPPYSPGLNPIENLWSDLKSRIEAHSASNLEELKEFITLEWSKTTPEYCASLAHSMPHRCELVVAARGHKTPY